MKKILLTLAAAAMVTTPAYADHGYGRGFNHHEYREHHEDRHEGGCGLLCGIIIGGAVIGVLGSTHNRNQQVTEPVRTQQLVCQNEYVRDYYGNYVLDQNGRAIYTQRCWYQ